jgi:hypothetical protein
MPLDIEEIDVTGQNLLQPQAAPLVRSIDRRSLI